MTETNAEYHADTTHVSSSMLKALQRSPRLYEWTYIDPATPSVPTPAMLRGTAVHCAVLEPERFQREYLLLPPQFKTRASKAYKEWRADHSDDAVVLNADEMDVVRRCRDSLLCNPFVSTLLEKMTDLVVEQSFRWKQPWKDGDFLCKFRPDLIPVAAKTILDIKTTTDIEANKLRWACCDFGYALQASHYMEGASAIFGGTLDQWSVVLAFVETTPPYRTQAATITTSDIEEAHWQREGLLIEHARRVRENDWSDPCESEMLELFIPQKMKG